MIKKLIVPICCRQLQKVNVFNWPLVFMKRHAVKESTRNRSIRLQLRASRFVQIQDKAVWTESCCRRVKKKCIFKIDCFSYETSCHKRIDEKSFYYDFNCVLHDFTNIKLFERKAVVDELQKVNVLKLTVGLMKRHAVNESTRNCSITCFTICPNPR